MSRNYQEIEVILLNVPYAEKDEAKALGAWWSPDVRSWYVPDHLQPKLDAFARWLKKPSPHPDVRGKNEAFMGRTQPAGGFKALCECLVPPWDHCMHTEALA